MPLDPSPRVHTVAPEHWPRARRPVSNALWDAESMLNQARAGLYPSAARGSRTRDEEIAYWRARVTGADVAADADLDARPRLDG